MYADANSSLCDWRFLVVVVAGADSNMLSDDQEYVIQDNQISTRFLRYYILSIIFGIILLGISIAFSFLLLSYFLFYISLIFIFIGVAMVYMNQKLLYTFIISNESIMLTLTLKYSKGRYSWFSDRVEKTLFNIHWTNINQIKVNSIQISKSRFKNRKSLYTLRFVGESATETIPLRYFHEEKQLEILIALENYAKYMKKEYIEK